MLYIILELQIRLSALTGGYIIKLGMVRRIARYKNKQEFQDFQEQSGRI